MAATTLTLRRYRCQRCGAVVVSAPRGLLPRLRYGAVAVALALAQWACGEPGHRVRDAVSPLPCSGYCALHGWRSLRRWTACAHRLWHRVRGPTSDTLEVVRQLAACARVPTGQLTVDAASGALGA